MALKEELKEICFELQEMSEEDFEKELEEHKDGDIALAIMETRLKR